MKPKINNIDNDVLSLLLSRRSVSAYLLCDPGPTKEELQTILTAAIRVPDHGKLTPWRIKLVSGEGRKAFSKALIEAYKAETTDPKDNKIEKMQVMANAPLTCIIHSKLVPGSNKPISEQLLSCGALCQNLIIAANALGYSTNWLTGHCAFSPHFKNAINIDEAEQIIGFIVIGTKLIIPQERPRPNLDEIVSTWPE